MAVLLLVMRTPILTRQVLNGKVGALMVENAMKAKVGGTELLLYARATRDTWPHLIGGHRELVGQGGSFKNVPNTTLETWPVRGGSAGTMVYSFKKPVVYAYVNHKLILGVHTGRNRARCGGRRLKQRRDTAG